MASTERQGPGCCRGLGRVSWAAWTVLGRLSRDAGLGRGEALGDRKEDVGMKQGRRAGWAGCPLGWLSGSGPLHRWHHFCSPSSMSLDDLP